MRGSFNGHFICFSCIAYSKCSSLVTSATPEKFSQSAAALTCCIFLPPSTLGLTQISYFIFHSIRSHTVQARYSVSVKESCFPPADERKGGGGGEQCVRSLAGSHFSSAQFLKLNLFSPSPRFGARLLSATSLLHTFLDIAMRVGECHWHSASGVSLAPKAAESAQQHHLKPGQLFVLPNRREFL